MTTDADVEYETKTVRAVRDMESRTIKKWEGDGWELVTQIPGKLQTELTFRRPKSKSRLLLWIIGGGVLALILATVITIGVISERNAGTTETAAPSPSETISEHSSDPSPVPIETAASPEPEPEVVVLTPETSPELAALLVLTDYCSPDIAAFAAAHRGDTIAFPGYVGAMAPHNGATTRYDFDAMALRDALVDLAPWAWEYSDADSAFLRSALDSFSARWELPPAMLD